MSRKGSGSACSYKGCNNSFYAGKRRRESILFFRYPKDDELCNIWIENCGRSDLRGKGSVDLYNKYRVCNIHFTDEMYMNPEKKRLLPLAIPNKYCGLSEDLHQTTTEDSKMDISEGGLAQVKEEEGAMFHEIIENDIKIEVMKEELRPADSYVKCESCNRNSDSETECTHHINDKQGDLEQEQDDQLQVPSLYSADHLCINSFEDDVKPKVENTDSSLAQKQEDSIINLIDSGITVKEEYLDSPEYLDTPEYLSTNMDFVECEPGQVKTEDDIFFENTKIERAKEDPTYDDYEASLSSDMLQDDDSNEDIKPSSSKEYFKATANRNKRYCMVPGCDSSIISTPHKLFLPLPRDKNDRLSWQRAMRRTELVGERSSCYCCEDHFKLEEDAENYMQFKMMGNVKLKMKPRAVPSVFAWQEDPGLSRDASSKRRLPDVVQEVSSNAKKPRPSQAKEVRHQATQTDPILNTRDVGVQVNLCVDEAPKQTQGKRKKAPKKRRHRRFYKFDLD